MYDQKIHYCFTLSEEQMKYLRSKKYKIDRMECFMSLVELAERETKLVQVSKTQQVEILPGQVMVDNTQLAKIWDKDRKTVPKLIEAMEEGMPTALQSSPRKLHLQGCSLLRCQLTSTLARNVMFQMATIPMQETWA